MRLLSQHSCFGNLGASSCRFRHADDLSLVVLGDRFLEDCSATRTNSADREGEDRQAEIIDEAMMTFSADLGHLTKLDSDDLLKWGESLEEKQVQGLGALDILYDKPLTL